MLVGRCVEVEKEGFEPINRLLAKQLLYLFGAISPGASLFDSGEAVPKLLVEMARIELASCDVPRAEFIAVETNSSPGGRQRS